VYVPEAQVLLAPYLTKAVPLKLQKTFSAAQVVHVGTGVGVGVSVGMGVLVGMAVTVEMAVSVGMALESKI
jgi:hypothetical protein